MKKTEASAGITRQTLLENAAGIANTLQRQLPADEAAATLTLETITALEKAGMFRLKLPAVLSGAEADPSTQILVIEALACMNPAAGWCTMVGATSIGLPGAFLAEEAIAEIFADGKTPHGAIVAAPAGRAEVVAGGYLLSGRWPFASGVRHSEWITAGTIVKRNGHFEHRMMVFPTSSAEIHDNWQVAGLKGTGSCDFSVEQIFVPNAFTWCRTNDKPLRGGPLYRIEFPGFVVNEHAGVALGIARRGLDAFIEKETGRQRGFASKSSKLSARPAVQRLIGVADLKLRAARNLAVEINDVAWDTVRAGKEISVRLQGEMRAVATHCTEVALHVVTEAFRYSGGNAVYDSNTLQQCLRDMNVAAQHLMVNDIAYENLGQIILGLPSADPMR